MRTAASSAGADPAHPFGSVDERHRPSPPQPATTVLISTRNRSHIVGRAVNSVLASQGIALNLIVIDQSDDDASVAALPDDPRVRYIRTPTVGVSRSRNIGLRASTTEVTLILDDDVEVGPDWARLFWTAMKNEPRAAIGFCTVQPGPHDQSLGFIPAHSIARAVTIRGRFLKSAARGIGAGMAVRTDMALQLGGFDEMLGPGAPLRSAEDRDLATRALIAGWWVEQVPQAVAVHHGFRSWQEGAELSRRDWFGIGALYAKQVRVGNLRALPVLTHEVLYSGIVLPLGRLLRGQPPRGIRKVGYFAHGFAAGLRATLDHRHLVYRDSDDGGP